MVKVVLLQQYNCLGTLQGDLQTLYANASFEANKETAKMYIEDGFVWIEEMEGLPELLLLASTEKLVEMLQHSVGGVSADVAVVDVATKENDNGVADIEDDLEDLEPLQKDEEGNEDDKEVPDEKNDETTQETDEKDSGDVDVDVDVNEAEKEAEQETEDTSALNEAVESLTLQVDPLKEAEADQDEKEDTDAEKSNDEKTEEMDAKDASDLDGKEADAEAGEQEMEQNDAAAADEEPKDPTDEPKDPVDEAVQVGNGNGNSNNRSKKSKKKTTPKKEMPPEDLVFQKLTRTTGLGDIMRVALEDIRAMKQRDYDTPKIKKSGGRNKSLSNHEQRLAAMEHKRRRLHEQLSNDNIDTDNNNYYTAPEDSEKEDPWTRLIRFLNSVRLLAQILPPMLLHERRNDKGLSISTTKLQTKRNPSCWLLGEHVYDIVSGSVCKSNYRLLNEVFCYYFGMPRTFQLTVQSTPWRETLEQTMNTAIQQQRRSGADDEAVKAPWIDLHPLESLLDADAIVTKLPVLEKLTLQLDEQFLTDTAGENPEQHERYLQSVTRLHERLSFVLKQKFSTARLSIYGSCLSDLSLAKSSDVDLSLYFDYADNVRNSFELGKISVAKYEKDMKGLVYDVCRKLEPRRDEFTDMQPVARARVPVVKGRYLKADNPHAADGSLHFDICFLNDIAVANSSLIREYSLVDQRVKQLMIGVKRWAKANNISSASDNSLSSYAWMNMVIFYLECVGLVPNLQDPKLMEKAGVSRDPKGNHWHRVNNLDTFFLTWEQASAVWEQPTVPSQWSSTALLYGFFRFYARDFPCSLFAVSIKRGRDSLLPKTSLQKCSVFYCIEDPFETFDSHCPHDLGTPAGEVGTKTLVRCLQEAESYCRETLLSLLGEDATPRSAITSLWPVRSVEKDAPTTGNGRNNQNNGGNGRGRGGRPSLQKQSQDRARGNSGRERQPSNRQPQNQRRGNEEKDITKGQEQSAGSKKAEDTVQSFKYTQKEDTAQPEKQNEDNAKPEQQSSNRQGGARPKKPRNAKQNQQVGVVMMDNGDTVVTTSQPNNTNSQDGLHRGKPRKQKQNKGQQAVVASVDQGNAVATNTQDNTPGGSPPEPSNGNRRGGRGGRGGRGRGRNTRNGEGNGQSNQESGGKSQAPSVQLGNGEATPAP